MNPPEWNTHLVVICILLIALDAGLVFAFVRECHCDACTARYAIWQRGERQLCRSCKAMHDRHAHRIGRRRSLLRRIFRAAS
jgi:hypothetical protein